MQYYLNNKKDIVKITSLLPPIIFLNRDINYGIGLEAVLEDYHIISSGQTRITKALKSNGYSIYNTPIYKNTSIDLLTDNSVNEYVDKIDNPHFLFFKPNYKYFKYCKKHKWKILNNPPSLSLKLENKMFLPKMLQQLNLNYPSTRLIRLSQGIEPQLFESFGDKFVIQFSRSFGGNNTFLIEHPDQIQQLIKQHSGKRAKATAFIEGWNLTINACVTTLGTVVSYPFFQIIGEEKLSTAELGSSGNDWGKPPIPDGVIQELIGITKTIGNYLQKQQYKGIFGLDFVVEYNTNHIYIIELNPRLIASIPIFTQSQLENDEIPMLLLHCLEFLDIDYKIDIIKLNEQLQHPRKLSQIILHNVENQPKSMVRFNKNIHTLHTTNYRLEDIQEKDSLFLPQDSDRTVSINNEIGRLLIKDNVYNITENKLNRSYNSLVEAIYQQIIE